MFFSIMSNCFCPQRRYNIMRSLNIYNRNVKYFNSIIQSIPPSVCLDGAWSLRQWWLGLRGCVSPHILPWTEITRGSFLGRQELNWIFFTGRIGREKQRTEGILKRRKGMSHCSEINVHKALFIGGSRKTSLPKATGSGRER